MQTSCYSKRYQLKDKAKDMLRGNYRPAIFICAMNFVINFSLQLLVSDSITPILPAVDLSDGFSVPALLPSYTITTVISLLLNIVSGLFRFGLTLFFLNMACGQPFSSRNLFYGFREDTSKVVIVSAVFTVLDMVCRQPYRFFISCYQLSSRDEKWLYAALIALAVGCCVYLPISLGLELSYFLMLDFPDNSAAETMKLSFRLMKGHKMRLFLLELSFLPLMLLGACSFSIGFLWIIPYMQMTSVNFFLDIMKPKETAQP